MDIKCGRQKETVHVLNKAGASKKKQKTNHQLSISQVMTTVGKCACSRNKLRNNISNISELLSAWL